MTARILTLADIHAKIAYEYYTTADQALRGISIVEIGTREATLGVKPFAELGRITLCFLVLQNGYVAVGSSATVSPEHFDEEVGRKFAKEDALRAVWAVLGYEAMEQAYRAKHRGCGDDCTLPAGHLGDHVPPE
jgi:hypothetical protein